MQIDHFVIALKTASVSEESLLSELDILKGKMQSTGSTSSKGASVIESIAKDVKGLEKSAKKDAEREEKIAQEEKTARQAEEQIEEKVKGLLEKIENRIGELKLFDTDKKYQPYPNWEHSHAARVLDLILNYDFSDIKDAFFDPENITDPKTKPSIGALIPQLESSLAALDFMEPRQHQAPIPLMQAGEAEVSADVKQKIIESLEKDIKRLMDVYKLDYKLIGQLDDQDIHAIVNRNDNNSDEKTNEKIKIVINRIMEIDNFVVQLKNTSVSENSLLAGLNELKGKMHSTGKRMSTSAGVIEGMMKPLQEKMKEMKRNEEAKTLTQENEMASQETILKVIKELEKERDSILKAHNLVIKDPERTEFVIQPIDEVKHSDAKKETKGEALNIAAVRITKIHSTINKYKGLEAKEVSRAVLQQELKSLQPIEETKKSSRYALFQSKATPIDAALRLVQQQKPARAAAPSSPKRRGSVSS